jgi:hypothetical protein
MPEFDEPSELLLKVVNEVDHLMALLSYEPNNKFAFILYLLSMAREEAYLSLTKEPLELQY